MIETVEHKLVNRTVDTVWLTTQAIDGQLNNVCRVIRIEVRDENVWHVVEVARETK